MVKAVSHILWHIAKHITDPFAGPREAVGSASESRARSPGFDTRSGSIPGPTTYFRSPSVDCQLLHLVLVNCLKGLSLLGNSVVR